MRATRSKLPTSEAAPAARGPALLFRTGENIKESGIYRVHHKEHRVPHEVTLLRGQRFPRCAKCDDSVAFELIVPAEEDPSARPEQTRIYLYQLPELEDDTGG